MPMSNIEVLLYLIVSLHDNGICNIFKFDDTLQAARELKTEIQQPVGDRVEICAKDALIKLKYNDLIDFVDTNRADFFLTETGKERIREIREECPPAAGYDADDVGDVGVRRSPRKSKTARKTLCNSPREIARKGRYYRRRLIVSPNDLIDARDEENTRLRQQLGTLIIESQMSPQYKNGGEVDGDIDVATQTTPGPYVQSSVPTSSLIYDPEDIMDVSYSGSDCLPSLCPADDSDSDSERGSPFSRTPSPPMPPLPSTPHFLYSGENAFPVAGPSSTFWHVDYSWDGTPKCASTQMHLQSSCDSNDTTLVNSDTHMTGDGALTSEDIAKMHAGFVQRSTEIHDAKMRAERLERMLEEKEAELTTAQNNMRCPQAEISPTRQRWGVWNWFKFARFRRRLDNSNTQLSGTIENLETQIAGVRLERDRLNERVTQLVEENIQLRSDLEDRIQTIRELQEKIEVDKIAHDTACQQRDAAQGKLVRLFDETRQTRERAVAAAEQSERMLSLF